jgi:hypothetical protein
MYSFCAGMKSYSGAANDGVECRAFRRFGRRGMPRNATEYRSEIRAAIVLFALNCADSDDAVRMRIALAEVNRLDKMHGYGTSTDSLDKLT